MNLPKIFRFFSQIFRFNLFEVSVMPCKSYHNRFISDWESFHFGAKILKASGVITLPLLTLRMGSGCIKWDHR